MKLRLRTYLALCFSFIVIITVSIVSILAVSLLTSRSGNFVRLHQRKMTEELAESFEECLSAGDGTLNADLVQGMGMYALKEGIIIRLYDGKKNVVWDAEAHEDGIPEAALLPDTPFEQEDLPGRSRIQTGEMIELRARGETAGYLYVSYFVPAERYQEELQHVRELEQLPIAAGIVSVIAAVLLGWFFARRVIRPIAEVADVTRMISEGEYGVRLSTKRKVWEMSELVEAINQMAASLEEQEVLRKQMTSDIAHELRTPVANLSSYLEMIQEGVLSPTPERLENCGRELERLSGLISDLERLEDEERRRIIPDTEPVELLELSRSAARGFETRFREKDIEWSVSGDASRVPADGARIQQVLVNLISNAVKYTDAGGRIAVRVSDRADCGIISVEDSGIGIPEKDLNRVFERFYRTDKSRTRKTGGAGIGLSISKAIVQAHGGTIVCESRVGEGSRFIVTLPKDLSAANQASRG